ncbi:TniQ family protein [Ralstonia wenshanensis]|uniref:TniQ domain-containing protein n=1 Tax=Ralstonia wenshanensis TaxID=2842456 RepID=A0AAD2EGB1_9RALS|nr:hypothetical protein LMG18091_00009 [Ralstonia wenshanensis]
MVFLPFVPKPYPDEILGSWLARVPLYNGLGAWRALLDECGFGQRPHIAIFDLASFSANLHSLLVALGTNYNRALVELTTYSYWATFDAAADKILWSGGVEKLPALSFNNRQPVKSLKSAGVWARGGHTRRIRCCPCCLQDDLREYGEVYWHRSHNLPNIWFCTKHNCPLQHQCPRCGRVPKFSIRDTTVARLACACGQDLRRRADGPRPSPALLRLAEMSLQALNAGVPEWNRNHARSFLRELAVNRDYPEILSSTYDLGWDTVSVRSNRRAIGASPFSVVLNPIINLARAPEYCAFLAALHVDFLDITKVLRGRPTSNVYRRQPSLSFTNESTVEDVRSDLLQCLSRHVRRQCAGLWQYWFLRIRDADWMAQQFPLIARRKLPPISEDRKNIRQFFAKKIESVRTGLPISYRDSVACLRAQVRDRDWLSRQRGLFERQLKMTRDGNRKRIPGRRVKIIEEAIAVLLTREGRPPTIDCRRLADLTDLSLHQVEVVVRQYPRLRHAIDAANRDLPRRQLHWAASQLVNEGKRLSLTSMARRAGLGHKQFPKLAGEAQLIIAAHT